MKLHIFLRLIEDVDMIKNLLRTLLRSSQVLLLTVALTLLVLTPLAIAQTFINEFSVPIENGMFDVNVTFPVPSDREFRVGSAVVSLPDNETGMLEKIIITGPNEKRLFGCFNIKVKNGTDLIKACGGPAYLVTGDTRYEAKGIEFQPLADATLSIKLFE